MKSRKKTTKRSNAKPTAKQLAARKKFAAAAKVKNSLGSEAYIQAKKYPDGRYRLFYRGTRNEVFPGRFFKSAKEARQYFLTQKAKENPNRRNSKTIIVKPRKITLIQVGKLVRRKVRNGYVDLVIRGQATKTPQGWKVGKKTIPQGKGTVLVSSGYYLDKASGTIFAKRARNVAAGFYDSSGVFHPIRSAADYDDRVAGETGKKPIRTRSKKKIAATRKASATARQRAETKRRKATTTRLATRSLQRSVSLKRKRQNSNGASPAVKKLREQFTGQKSRKTAQVFAPAGTPANVAKLGKLALIETETARIKPTGTVYLCADAKGKLHLCGATDAPLYSGSRQNFGQVLKVEYETAKPHLYPGQGTILFYHRMGEEGGKRPTLIGDGKGGLKFRGGSYKITREGIVD